MPTNPPPLPIERPPGKGLRGLVFKAVLLLALVATGFVLVRFTPLAEFLERERLAATLGALREAWWSPLLLLGLYAVLAPMGLPMTPLIFAGAVVFGTGWAILWNSVGCFFGAALSFLAGRFLGRDLIVRVAGDRLRGVERLILRHGFWSLVRIRFLPIPFALVNYGAALAGVGLPTFLASAAIGLLPAIGVFTYFFATLAHAAAEDRRGLVFDLVLALGALLALSLLPAAIQRWTRWRRYGRLLANRRRAGRSDSRHHP